MIIKIRQPLCFKEQGRKNNQEDSLYPLQDTATAENKYFLVCDGVGGSDHGEVASATVSKAIGEYFGKQELPDGVLTESIFNLALEQAYNSLDAAYAKYADSFKKMATTLTFLGIHRGGCLIAHIGDSRVYHIRPGIGILSRTNDHSLVNDLLKAGELTPEQAKNFKQKNIITRAMQPLMETRDRAEFTPVIQVQDGDYFFLCCDGVLEHLEDEKLVEILSDTATNDAEKLAAIKKVCDDGDTHDNYTCYLIPIDSVESEPDFDASLVSEEVVGEVEPATAPMSLPHTDFSAQESEPTRGVPHINTNIPPTAPRRTNMGGTKTYPGSQDQAKSSSANYMKIIAAVLFLALVACVAFIFFSRNDDEKQENQLPAVPTKEQPASQQTSPQENAPTKIIIREERNRPSAPAARPNPAPAQPANGNKNVTVSLPETNKPEATPSKIPPKDLPGADKPGKKPDPAAGSKTPPSNGGATDDASGTLL